jgi:hypothetical protein
VRAGFLSTAALSLCACVLNGVAAQPASEPKYLQRLEFPNREETFKPPRAVTADLHTGEIFVCDMRGRRIVIYDRYGTFSYQIPSGTRYGSPLDVAVDPEGFLFVLTFQGRTPIVAMLDFDGLYLGEFELPIAAGSTEPPDPVSLAISPTGDRLYVMDQASGGRLWILDRTGEVLREIDLVLDKSWEWLRGRLLGRVDVYGDIVLESFPVEGRIRLRDLDGNIVSFVGMKGTSRCRLGLPIAAAMDGEGRIYVTDRQRMVYTIWDPVGNRCLGEYSGIGRSPGALYNPIDLTLNSDGKLYISQGFEGRVQVYQVEIPPPAPGESVPRILAATPQGQAPAERGDPAESAPTGPSPQPLPARTR